MRINPLLTDTPFIQGGVSVHTVRIAAEHDWVTTGNGLEEADEVVLNRSDAGLGLQVTRHQHSTLPHTAKSKSRENRPSLLAYSLRMAVPPLMAVISLIIEVYQKRVLREKPDAVSRSSDNSAASSDNYDRSADNLSTTEQKALSYMGGTASVRSSEVANLLGMSQRGAQKLLNRLVDKGFAVSFGANRNRRYSIAKGYR